MSHFSWPQWIWKKPLLQIWHKVWRGGLCIPVQSQMSLFFFLLWAVTLPVTYCYYCNWCSADLWMTWPTQRAAFSSSLQSFCSSGTHLTLSTARRAVGEKEHCLVREFPSCTEQNTYNPNSIQIESTNTTMKACDFGQWTFPTESSTQTTLCHSSWG